MKKISILNYGWVGQGFALVKLSLRCAFWAKKLPLPSAASNKFYAILALSLVLGGIAHVVKYPDGSVFGLFGYFLSVALLALMANTSMWRHGAMAMLLADLFLSALTLLLVPVWSGFGWLLNLYGLALAARYLASPLLLPLENFLAKHDLLPDYSFELSEGV